MKIALIYDPIYPYVIGGGEKRFWEIARRLAKCGHQVYLVGMKYWNGPAEIIKEGVHLVGICPAVPLYNKKGTRSFFEPFYFGFFVFWHLLFNNYDLIDCANFPYISCISLKLISFFKRIRFTLTWHEVWGRAEWISYAGIIGIFGWLIEKIVSLMAGYNIFVSKFMQNRAVSIFRMKKEKTIVIENGIEYNKLSKIENIRKDNQIIYVGRLVNYKRVDILIDAFAIFINDFKDYSLKIIGRGPESAKLKLKVQELKLEDKVVFVDFLEKDDLEKEIKKSKIFVLPSEREGMGIVIVESMALGTPVIALESENSAAKTIITNGSSGILVKNINELVQAMTQLLTNEELYNKIVQQGLETAKSYDWDSVIIPHIIKYYGEIINENIICIST